MKPYSKYRLLLLLFVTAVPVISNAHVTEISLLPEPVVDSDFYDNGKYPQAQIKLGQLLFFDRILSGNKNIACATCHHPRFGTSDGVSLSFGEGAVGLAQKRHTVSSYPVSDRVPRNASALYFLGAKQFNRLFHDGRVEKDTSLSWSSGYWTPARQQLPNGLNNVLAVQAMFPVTSLVEMAGQKGENDIANAASLREFNRVWQLLALRLQSIPEYVRLFKEAFPHIKRKQDIHFVDAANAIAAFETVAFRADNSLFDEFLKTGNHNLLPPAALRGMKLFYGRANCSTCHSGKFFTDQSFHAIAMPQIGPGKNDGWDSSFWQATGYFKRVEDHGRGRVTFREEDNYKFRTPSLRNVTLTGPWGHAGSYQALEDVVRHHAAPVESLNRYQVAEIILPEMQHIVEKVARGSRLIYQEINPYRLTDYRKHETWIQMNPELRQRIANANELQAVSLTDLDIQDLVAFLNVLTDPASQDADRWVPGRVPSGLIVDR